MIHLLPIKKYVIITFWRHLMAGQKPIWWDWVDLNTEINDQLKLFLDAPEDIKRIFEEDMIKEAEDRSNEIWR